MRSCPKTIALLALFLAGGAPAVPAEAGRYRNPILYSDYSDPDVIRAEGHYYLVASTFSFVPGIPILRSDDLVHWSIAGHVLPRLGFAPQYDLAGGNRYGGGVWAPALREHGGRYYVYFPTPDEGIFMCSAPHPTGPWSAPIAVLPGPGWEDPCPFWDDDGRAYLIHSRKGAGPLYLHRLSPDGTRLLDAGRVIVRDPLALPVLEGPKLYKRHGYYYIFAPYGGVAAGAQAVLRSRSIWGPYAWRTVLAPGRTDVNGPHQGAYVETPQGAGWFIHFQSRGAHGRIDWLEPVRWQDDWPLIGDVAPGAITGQPVAGGPLPVQCDPPSEARPQTSDEFDGPVLGPQWEWNHNPDNRRWSLTERPGFLRLHAGPAPDLLAARNTLTQQMQNEAFHFAVRLEIGGLRGGDRAGMAMFEKRISGLEIRAAGAGRRLWCFHLAAAEPGPELGPVAVILRVDVRDDAARYSYSVDEGRSFVPLGEVTRLTFSWWKGARPALFAYHVGEKAGGYMDVDWAHYVP